MKSAQLMSQDQGLVAAEIHALAIRRRYGSRGGLGPAHRDHGKRAADAAKNGNRRRRMVPGCSFGAAAVLIASGRRRHRRGWAG